MNILFGVTGGIAAYKAVMVVRLLKEAGHQVTVIPTAAALEMVGATTWEAISGNPVPRQLAGNAANVEHINLAKAADLFLIAPATANTIAKLAQGVADNFLTAAALVARCPMFLAPAMHTEMWTHPATQANIALLASRGVHFIGPEVGRLTGKDTGIGRMSEPETIFTAITAHLADENFSIGALTGRKVFISGGGTYEPIDPVRYIANRSTGHMAIALANAARQLGAQVCLAAANIDDSLLCQLTTGITVIPVVTAQDLYEVAIEQAQDSHVVVMAAAVSDYRVANYSSQKIKRGSELQLSLTPNPDILAHLAANRSHPQQVVVGFAAETGDDTQDFLSFGKVKAQRKKADIIAINEVSATAGFGAQETALYFVDKTGKELGKAQGDKPTVAKELMVLITSYLDEVNS